MFQDDGRGVEEVLNEIIEVDDIQQPLTVCSKNMINSSIIFYF